MATKNELATTKEALPAYLKDNSGPARGSEQAGVDDIVLPRLLLLQQLSPQIDSDSENYIEEAKAGDVVNSLTGEVYGREVLIVPVYFRKEYIVWKDRQKGGGFCGAFKTPGEAKQAVLELDPPLSDYNIEDTATQFVLIVKKDGSLEQAVLSMSRTKLACSRKLQSFIRMTEADSFASQYALQSVSAQSDKGKYFTLSVKPKGFVPEEVYYAGESVYKAITEQDANYVAHDVVDGGDTTSF